VIASVTAQRETLESVGAEHKTPELVILGDCHGNVSTLPLLSLWRAGSVAHPLSVCRFK
jgi:hypothetical protein